MNKIILDPTGLYQPLTDYLVITNEVEWLQSFPLESSAYWIKGKRLCDWTKEWLRVWNKDDLIIEIKQHPRPKLEAIFAPFSIPNNWDDQHIFTMITQLDSYASNHPIESLLAGVTNTEDNFWLIDKLSVEHLAQWLCIEVPQVHQIFENVWKHKISQNHDNDNLISYYQSENKHQILINWLGLGSDLDIINILGKYHLNIPDVYLKEFSDFWRQKIYQTEAEILDELILHQQTGNEIIASIAYDILSNKPIWNTPERINKISFYLGNQKTSQLQQQLPPIQPLLLSIDASPQDALEWVTES